MRGPDEMTMAAVKRRGALLRRDGRGAPWLAARRLLGTAAISGGGLADPSRSASPMPNYTDVCAPIGADTSSPCLRVTLAAIDTARAAEGLRPMRLPADFAGLTVPEQLFVAVDSERVDRGLAPFTGLSTALDLNAQKGADAAQLPPGPGAGYAAVDTEWIGAIDNGLDADFQWMYDDGPNSGVPRLLRHPDVGLLGRPPDRAGPLRHPSPRDGCRLRPVR